MLPSRSAHVEFLSKFHISQLVALALQHQSEVGCEALSSDVGGRGALRVLLERGVKFRISGNSFQVLQVNIHDIKG